MFYTTFSAAYTLQRGFCLTQFVHSLTETSPCQYVAGVLILGSLFCSACLFIFLMNKSYFRERPPTCPGTSEWLAGICLSIGKSNKGVSFSGKDGQAFTWPCLLWIHTW